MWGLEGKEEFLVREGRKGRLRLADHSLRSRKRSSHTTTSVNEPHHRSLDQSSLPHPQAMNSASWPS